MVGLVRTGLIIALAPSCVADVDILHDGDMVVSAAFGTRNETGYGDTYFANGFDANNPFFKSMGTNGRACVTCHQQDQGWTLTPTGVRTLFNETDGNDPLFRTNDGAVSPTADVSTRAARESAYRMLISKGLIRIGLPIPSNAEFTLYAVDDPYTFASAAELSLFRRPPPSTNLPFLATVMWDGRETLSSTDMESNFRHQAASATLGHAQATGVDTTKMDAIVAFETTTFVAQTKDNGAGPLNNNGAKGGPQELANTQFYIGINDPLTGGFNQNAMSLFDNWVPPPTPATDVASGRRYAVFRGQRIFNTRPIAITGVKGLNDFLGQATIMGTCTTCHNTPNVGNHSTTLPINIGIADASRRTSDMPLYTLRNKTTGDLISVTDPGRALISGKWADIGKFKGPVLRGLQMRPPYFHDGSAASLQQVIDFYNSRFSLGLTAQEQSDLLAFLQTL